MPTTKPRHTLTETDELARVLDDAAAEWPEDAHARRRLLVRLVKEGHDALLTQRQARAARRRDAIRRTSGALTGCYPAGYLAELRDEWPA